MVVISSRKREKIFKFIPSHHWNVMKVEDYYKKIFEQWFFKQDKNITEMVWLVGRRIDGTFLQKDFVVIGWVHFFIPFLIRILFTS